MTPDFDDEPDGLDALFAEALELTRQAVEGDDPDYDPATDNEPCPWDDLPTKSDWTDCDYDD